MCGGWQVTAGKRHSASDDFDIIEIEIRVEIDIIAYFARN